MAVTSSLGLPDTCFSYPCWRGSRQHLSRHKGMYCHKGCECLPPTVGGAKTYFISARVSNSFHTVGGNSGSKTVHFQEPELQCKVVHSPRLQSQSEGVLLKGLSQPSWTASSPIPFLSFLSLFPVLLPSTSEEEAPLKGLSCRLPFQH